VQRLQQRRLEAAWRVGQWDVDLGPPSDGPTEVAVVAARAVHAALAAVHARDGTSLAAQVDQLAAALAVRVVGENVVPAVAAGATLWQQLAYLERAYAWVAAEDSDMRAGCVLPWPTNAAVALLPTTAVEWPTLEAAHAVHGAALAAVAQAGQGRPLVMAEAIRTAQVAHALEGGRLARHHHARSLAFTSLLSLQDGGVRPLTVALEHAELLHEVGFADKAVSVAHAALATAVEGAGSESVLLQARLRCAIGGWLGSARARAPALLLSEYFEPAITLVDKLPRP
jgi:hypothetical protein